MHRKTITAGHKVSPSTNIHLKLTDNGIDFNEDAACMLNFYSKYFTGVQNYHVLLSAKSFIGALLPVEHVVLNFNISRCGNADDMFSRLNEAFNEGTNFMLYTETSDSYKNHYGSYRFKWLGSFLYFWLFLFHRAMPKLNKSFQKLYLRLSGGKRIHFSRAELMGLLYKKGFYIRDSEAVNNRLVLLITKKCAPDNSVNHSYWPVFKMQRIGKDGKKIFVYKLRTMHPYAEYLQEYIRVNNGLATGGKFKDDFRIASWGRFLRKVWIDELPMILNLLKGDIKLVGVRPISQSYFQLYTKELQDLRNKTRPGLIPPFYAETPTPKTLDDVMQSEIKYLLQYTKHPLKTDVKYFFKIFYNIVFKKARSK